MLMYGTRSIRCRRANRVILRRPSAARHEGRRALYTVYLQKTASCADKVCADKDNNFQ